MIFPGFFSQPLKYNEPLFRPPGEARSAILQATIGCSWNRCSFCEMYTSKKFQVKPPDVLKKEINILANHYRGIAKKVFLGDGNAFVLSYEKLLPILQEINTAFGRLQRVSAYASPKDILDKTPTQLETLRSHGLKLLYVGAETGDDELLSLINKGETFASTSEALLKAHSAGIDTSVMILNGLGGRNYSHQHAKKSAELINLTNPKFLSTLTLSFPMGEPHYHNRFGGDFELQTVPEIIRELRWMIEDIDAERVIYRSNHVSNNLVLSGTLSRDKSDLLAQIDLALNDTNL
ncbi:radical SAM protein [Natronoflexus pectinivorans]|uniref:Radical SAM family protein n=1 Tax=Natronoflexus pectinivorans TaxID=682526 RepID=A0A4R2GLU6_9BACT|nr:radical SAM protein [Natronoflexus pectinivorans]TCO08461.1 radical SAM family protein [Natronoflexus pectinivorans]